MKEAWVGWLSSNEHIVTLGVAGRIREAKNRWRAGRDFPLKAPLGYEIN